jgi:hypothetical protein
MRETIRFAATNRDQTWRDTDPDSYWDKPVTDNRKLITDPDSYRD